MTESGVRGVTIRVGRALVASVAAQAAAALGIVALALRLVFWATGVLGVTAATERTLTTVEAVAVPLVLAWASVITVVLGRWLWTTTLPEDVGGEGWDRVRRLLWVEWGTQALRWLGLLGLVNLALFLPVAWVQWAGLAVGVEAVVAGDSPWVLAAPVVVWGLVVLGWAGREFRRGYTAG